MSVDQISGPKKDLSLLLRLAKAGEIYLQHPKEKQNDWNNYRPTQPAFDFKQFDNRRFIAAATNAGPQLGISVKVEAYEWLV